MQNLSDPKSDIFAIMDKVNLTGGYFLQGRKTMTALVLELRVKLAFELTEYINQREQEIRGDYDNQEE